MTKRSETETVAQELRERVAFIRYAANHPQANAKDALRLVIKKTIKLMADIAAGDPEAVRVFKHLCRNTTDDNAIAIDLMISGNVAHRSAGGAVEYPKPSHRAVAICRGGE